MGMKFFSKSAAVDPEPTVQESRTLREAELLAELHALDARLRAVHDEAREFQKRHRAFVNGVSLWRVEKPGDRAGLEAEWHGLSSRCNRLIQERNAVLHEWAQLKLEAQHV